MERESTDLLRNVRGNAPARNPSISVLASATHHSDCPVAMLALASRVDTETLCAGTRFEAPFGQDPQAFERGLMFERIVKQHGHAAFIAMLRESAGFFPEDARILDLSWAKRGKDAGLKVRAQQTRVALVKMARNDADAPNLIDAGVLSVDIAGQLCYFEADGLAAASQGRIHVAEIKSFPIVDGRCDNEKLGSAKNQAAFYAMLCRMTLEREGLRGNAIADEGFIILPRGVGLQPALLREDLSQNIWRAEQLLNTARQAATPEQLPRGLQFPAPGEDGTIVALEDMMDRVGTRYRGDCLAHCGFARLCRERAHIEGSPSLCGTRVVQQMPGVHSLHRACELITGAPAAPSEAHVASVLRRADAMYQHAVNGGGL